jgi:chromosome segregation ATPase
MDLVAQIFSRNQELTKELDAKQEFNKNLEIKLAQREMELQTAKQGKEEAVAKYNQIWEAHYKKVQEHNKTKTTETKNTSQERSHIKNTLDTMETMISKIDSMILKILIEQKQFKKDMQSIKKVMNIAEEKIEESDEWRD